MTSDTLKEDVIRDLHRLPPEALREVHDFIGLLQRKSSSKTVFDDIDASIQAVADEDWQEVPEDASERLDEYLYRSSRLRAPCL